MSARRGFTLLELLIVVTIVGILSTVAAAIYRGHIRRAISTEGTALLGSVSMMERLHHTETGTFTADKVALRVELVGQKCFTDYAVLSADADGFVSRTTGSGTAAGIIVTMVYRKTGGAIITVTGL